MISIRKAFGLVGSRQIRNISSLTFTPLSNSFPSASRNLPSTVTADLSYSPRVSDLLLLGQNPLDAPASSGSAVVSEERLSLPDALRLKIENYRLDEAEEMLLDVSHQIEAEHGAPTLLELVMMLRLKQDRLEVAFAARDTLLEHHNDYVRANPAAMCLAAELFALQNKPGTASQFLKDAVLCAEHDVIFHDITRVRSVVHQNLGDFKKATSLLHGALILSNGELINLAQDRNPSAAIRLCHHYLQVLLQMDRAYEAEPLCGPLLHACDTIHGPEHVVTLLAKLTQAEVLKGNGKPREALDVIETMLPFLVRKLGSHDIVLQVVNLRAKLHTELFFASYYAPQETKAVSSASTSSTLLARAQEAVSHWLTMVRILYPDDQEKCLPALQHRSLLDLVVSVELQEHQGACGESAAKKYRRIRAAWLSCLSTASTSASSPSTSVHSSAPTC